MQVMVLPVADRHEEYAADLAERLRGEGFRSELSGAHLDTLGARVRRAKLDKVPYVLVVGDDDVAAGTAGVNVRGAERPVKDVPFDDFLADLRAVVASRGNV